MKTDIYSWGLGNAKRYTEAVLNELMNDNIDTEVIEEKLHQILIIAKLLASEQQKEAFQTSRIKLYQLRKKARILNNA
ncbi:MAG: hypothetical protein QW478_04730 [Candidatus Micrarchaeaceae archaeon]